jgi:hypothetical protein
VQPLKRLHPAKLFVGMLAQHPQQFLLAAESLGKFYGPIDFESISQPWNYTDYYAREFGRGLIRKFIFFEQLISAEALWKIKRESITMEKQMGTVRGERFCRRINLDPGYLTDSKLVLATTKDFSHRIFLKDGIYAEATLIYQGNGFKPMSHTYPDYRTPDCLRLFDQAREIFRRAGQSLP